MWVADMDFEVADFIRDAVVERAAHPIYGYTFRPKRFYEIVSGWMQKRHQWITDPGWISFSPGIVPALNLSVLAYTEPGDKILVQPPVYFPFFTAVKDHNRELVYNQLLKREGKYEIDFEDLEEKFKSGVKMMLLCQPHNPVGRIWNTEELKQLADLCVRYEVLVISDEIHSDLILFDNRHIPLACIGEEIASRTITCVAPSKTFNLAGLHSSALIISDKGLKKKYDRELEKMHIGGGNLFGMIAMEAAYQHGENWLMQLNLYLEKNFSFLKAYLQKEVPEIGVSSLEATYLVWMDLSFLKKSDAELKRFIIEEARLGLNDGPMFGPGGEGHQRINIAAPTEILEEGLSRLVGAVKASYI